MKVTAKIDATEAEALAKKLSEMADEITGANKKAAAVLQREFAKYPPARPNSSYVRTMTLGRNWDIKNVSAKGFTLANKVKYASFVQSGKDQARVHRRRWRTVEAMIKGSMRKIGKFYNDIADKLSRM